MKLLEFLVKIFSIKGNFSVSCLYVMQKNDFMPLWQQKMSESQELAHGITIDPMSDVIENLNLKNIKDMTLALRNRNNGFPAFNSIFNEILNDDIFGSRSISEKLPAVNIKQTETDFSLELAIPGLTKDDVKIAVDKDILTISSEKESKVEEKEEDGTYTRREFSYHSFERSFTLPESVDTDKINAKFENGVLFLHLPKKKEALPKPARVIKIS
jgi:HSP20 family protein